jgi:hypothetical protein
LISEGFATKPLRIDSIKVYRWYLSALYHHGAVSPRRCIRKALATSEALFL